MTRTSKSGVEKIVFLSNVKSKQNIINLIGETLSESGIDVKHATEDTDLLTVQTAIQYAKSLQTIVTGEDTDILILLWHYEEPGSNPIVYQTTNRRWDIHHLVEMSGDLK